MKEIWIFAEQNDGIIANSFFEILSKAKSLYAAAKEQPCFVAVYFGPAVSAEALKESGVDKLILVESDKLSAYQPEYYSEALIELAQSKKPDILFIAASAVGSELAPAVAARLRTGLAAHCTELKLDEAEELHMIAPAFGGKLMGEYIIPGSRPVMASIKPGVFDREALEAKSAEVESVAPACLETLDSRIELVSRQLSESDELPVEKAEAVVCAGLGCAASGNLEKAKDFAKLIGASVCYTRPLADLGYYPNENSMVGTSGKTIKPKLYIGFGVSGAGQHVCGMKDSGLIINVNNDEEALCFDISNYKAVSDCGAVLEELLNKLKK